MTDKEDIALEALFKTTSIPDAGFSSRVVASVNRRIRLRRVLLPVAVAAGGMVAFPALAEIATVIPVLADNFSRTLGDMSGSGLPALSWIMIAAIAAAAALCAEPLVDD